jgi:hypothetical protein
LVLGIFVIWICFEFRILRHFSGHVSCFEFICSIPWRTRRRGSGHALREMFSSNPRPRGEGMGEGRQPSNYLVDCFLNEVNGRSWPSGGQRSFSDGTTRPWDSPHGSYESSVCPNWSAV